MIYPIMILYTVIILLAEAIRRMVRSLAIQSQERKLAKI
jgi:hypothetical protein